MLPQCPPQAHAPPHAQPPLAGALPVLPAAKKENRRLTRSLPHDGQATAVSTLAFIERCCSKRCSQRMHTYS